MQTRVLCDFRAPRDARIQVKKTVWEGKASSTNGTRRQFLLVRACRAVLVQSRNVDGKYVFNPENVARDYAEPAPSLLHSAKLALELDVTAG